MPAELHSLKYQILQPNLLHNEQHEFQKNFNAGYTLQIINFIGKQVYEAKNVNSSTTLDLSNYTRGVYIYQLKDPSGKVIESGKFQVSK